MIQKIFLGYFKSLCFVVMSLNISKSIYKNQELITKMFFPFYKNLKTRAGLTIKQNKHVLRAPREGGHHRNFHSQIFNGASVFNEIIQVVLTT